MEDPEYIDILIANVKAFTNSDTKIALHLSNLTQYAAQQMVGWSSDRVVVTERRIPVYRFQGSIFAAHLLNAWALEKQWPGECAYYVMQASNQMWVRRGMENHVRKYKYSKIDIIKEAWVKNEGHPFYGLMFDKKGLHGHGQPEGAFYPMSTVLSLGRLLNGFLLSTGQSLEVSVAQYLTYFEASWLQTYALNMDEPPPPAMNEMGDPPCFRQCHASKDDNLDSVYIEDVHRTMDGKDDFENFYSVKRVSRDVRNPITQFIAQISGYKGPRAPAPTLSMNLELSRLGNQLGPILLHAAEISESACDCEAF